jgi:hypothetical protein
MEQFLILMAILIGIIVLYVGTMYLNSKVAIPESCKEAYLEAQHCESCPSNDGGSCGFSDTLEFMKEVKL